MSDPQKSETAKREEEILRFWQERGIFKKSLAKPSPRGEFVFYEGPPTANGRPGIHHLESRAFKDAIPRFRTMQGYHVRRKAGWDTHGLPVELEVEKQIGSKNKKDIEQFGIAKFNALCKESVLKYIDEWKKFTDRIAFWVDHDDTYFTFDNSYIESVWNILKTANEKKLLYKDYKVVPWCPRCGTALSSHEVAQGYQDDTPDPSVYVKFPVKKESAAKIGLGGDVYLLAWTTTPWTLPGNVALAVNLDTRYIAVHHGNGYLIVAKDRMEALGLSDPNSTYEYTGRNLVDVEYEPLYPFLKDSLPPKEKEKLPNAYKVYAADFVSTEEGTGIVHTAVMYGADDFELGTKVGLPKHHLVGEDGKFTQDAGPLAGQFFKKADEWVMNDLESRGLLFKKEIIKHTYPFCWRCKTPLMYYADDSWYIAMSRVKDTLISENESIHWEPEHIREGRFGEWLKDVKDWAISRSRFWGTPLPIWECEKCKRFEVIGSIDELQARLQKSGNSYFLMRHGESENNVLGINSYGFDSPRRLTSRGREQVAASLKELKGPIDLIISSPILRAKETATLAAEKLGFPSEKIVFDERLREVNLGPYENKKYAEYDTLFPHAARFDAAPEGGETLNDVRIRVGELLFELERRYSGKNILIVSHGDPLWQLEAAAQGLARAQTLELGDQRYLSLGETRELTFRPLPLDGKSELDLHRPFIDEPTFTCSCGGNMKRVPEVLDVWFDSGAMPFAQDHYPFATKHILYPADFISEAIDQTRGWFYTLHAIGAGIMQRGKAFKNVICLGHVLDSKGKKMSKSVGNVVDPWTMIDKYGVDALRFFMFTVNAPGDSKNFDERMVDEIVKKNLGRLANVLAFYKLYDAGVRRGITSQNVLDQWILTRLNQLIRESTRGFENYQIDVATRPIASFIDDLSVWYLRRSRDRFKEESGDKEAALATLRYVLFTLSQVMAPSMPFFAEHLYQSVKGSGDEESVHLSSWPKVPAKGLFARLLLRDPERDLARMNAVRKIVSVALEQREHYKIKVRQPLQRLTIPANANVADEHLSLIRDEVNVKEVVSSGTQVALDTNITDELREEGVVRDTIREIQAFRKESGLKPGQPTTYKADFPPEQQTVVRKHLDSIQKATHTTIEFN